MAEFPPCPKCKADLTYPSDNLLVCPMCFYEWIPETAEQPAPETTEAIKDAMGNILQDGDAVVVIKDLKVKGAAKAVKAGTKVKNIKLRESSDGHNIDCKIEGFGAMCLKSEFVKKA